MPDWGEGGLMSVYIRTENRNTGGVFVGKGGGPGTCKELSWFSGLSQRKVDIYQIR